MHLLFFWLKDVNLAKQRVVQRVQEGGHNIPKDVIVRRYYAGLRNLFRIFMSEVDLWVLFDNSKNQSERVAFGGSNIPIKVRDKEKFEIIRKYE